MLGPAVTSAPLIQYFRRQNPSPFSKALTEAKSTGETVGRGSIASILPLMPGPIHQPLVVCLFVAAAFARASLECEVLQVQVSAREEREKWATMHKILSSMRTSLVSIRVSSNLRWNGYLYTQYISIYKFGLECLSKPTQSISCITILVFLYQCTAI